MKSRFPETPAYLINWLGGSSGAFISLLLYNLIHKPEVSIETSVNGNAHVNQQAITKNYLISDNGTYSYERINPDDEYSPLILVEHDIPDLDFYFSKFPNGNVVIIQVDRKMIPRLRGNLYFKNICEVDYTQSSDIGWDKIRQDNVMLSEYTNPNDVPLELVKDYITTGALMHDIPHFYSSQYSPPVQYKDNIYTIRFYDIIHNPNKVLHTLSIMTKKPISNFVVQEYYKYLQKQDELVRHKMPWLNDA